MKWSRIQYDLRVWLSSTLLVKIFSRPYTLTLSSLLHPFVSHKWLPLRAQLAFQMYIHICVCVFQLPLCVLTFCCSGDYWLGLVRLFRSDGSPTFWINGTKYIGSLVGGSSTRCGMIRIKEANVVLKMDSCSDTIMYICEDVAPPGNQSSHFLYNTQHRTRAPSINVP